jgi:uncharacterized membrane protein HdeD (DUF308 family)
MSLSTVALELKPAQRNNAVVLFMLEGAMLVLFGLSALATPVLASFATAAFLGWTLIIAGIAVAYAAFAGRERRHLGWSLTGGVVMFAAGLLMLLMPLIGVIDLTAVMAVYLLVRSYALGGASFDQRRRGVTAWWTLLVASGVDLALAVLLFALSPDGALFALGLVVGIDLVASGVMLIALAVSVRKLSTQAKLACCGR